MTAKTVLVGVSGGIAAYKVAAFVRALRKQGWNVVVAMTAHACEFVTPLTFESLTGNPVVLDTFVRTRPRDVSVEHVTLAHSVDLAVLAPATANLIGKLAAGLADDALTTLVLSLKTQTPRVVFPSMNSEMLTSPIVQRNLEVLRGSGFVVVDAAEGELASGAYGPGRLPEPAEMLALLKPYAFDIKNMIPDDPLPSGR